MLETWKKFMRAVINVARDIKDGIVKEFGKIPIISQMARLSITQAMAANAADPNIDEQERNRRMNALDAEFRQFSRDDASMRERIKRAEESKSTRDEAAEQRKADVDSLIERRKKLKAELDALSSEPFGGYQAVIDEVGRQLKQSIGGGLGEPGAGVQSGIAEGRRILRDAIPD